MAWFLLGCHPVVFISAVLVIGSALAAGILLLLRRHALVLALVAAFLSAVGASSWLVELGLPGWGLALLLLWSAERFVTWSWHKSSEHLAEEET